MKEATKENVQAITETFAGIPFTFKDVIDVLCTQPPSDEEVKQLRNMFNNNLLRTGKAVRVKKETSPGKKGFRAVYLIKDMPKKKEKEKDKFKTSTQIGESIIRYCEELKDENESLKRQNADQQLEIFQLKRRIDAMNARLAGSPVSMKQLMG